MGEGEGKGVGSGWGEGSGKWMAATLDSVVPVAPTVKDLCIFEAPLGLGREGGREWEVDGVRGVGSGWLQL